MIENELGVVSDATDVHIVRRYVALLVLEKKMRERQELTRSPHRVALGWTPAEQ